jgi:2,5-diketo-D-gluconate reductase A
MTNPTFALNDGSTLPAIGLGTYGLRDGAGIDAIGTAIAAGYTLLDTALN